MFQEWGLESTGGNLADFQPGDSPLSVLEPGIHSTHGAFPAGTHHLCQEKLGRYQSKECVEPMAAQQTGGLPHCPTPLLGQQGGLD